MAAPLVREDSRAFVAGWLPSAASTRRQSARKFLHRVVMSRDEVEERNIMSSARAYRPRAALKNIRPVAPQVGACGGNDALISLYLRRGKSKESAHAGGGLSGSAASMRRQYNGLSFEITELVDRRASRLHFKRSRADF